MILASEHSNPGPFEIIACENGFFTAKNQGMRNHFTSVNKEGLKENHGSAVKESVFGVLMLSRTREVLYIDQKAKEVLSISFVSNTLFQNIQFLWKNNMAITTGKGDPVSYEKSPFAKVLETSEAQCDLLVIWRNDGSNQHLYFRCMPVFFPGETLPFSVVCYVYDITSDTQDRKSVKKFFNGFANQTSNFLWMIDEETNLLYANQAFLRYFGLAQKSLPDKIINVVPEAVASALYNDHIKVLQTNGPVRKEQKLRLADGTTSHFLVYIFPFTDENGKKMAGGHAAQLPDKYEIENQLRETNEQLLNINRAALNAIWEWDMKTGKIFRNQHLLDMIGYPVEETNDLNWWLDHLHPEDREQLTTTMNDAAEKRQMSWEQAYRFKCADDSYKYVIDRGFVVYENNQPVKMIGSLKDVTEVKELENRLMEEKLKKQKEISETMIQVQEKERTRLGVELHDNVNQILTSLRLYVGMLNPESPNEKTIRDKCLSYVDTAVEEIRKLSRDLVVPQLKGNTLVENIQLLIRDINTCNGLKIKFTHTHETDLLSPGKKLALFRITQEQVKNILKYSKAKEATIYLEYKDDNVELIIKDDGIGFNPKKTFQGVGLSSIHERARFYNGRVEIMTAEGKGCTLKVNIPL